MSDFKEIKIRVANGATINIGDFQNLRPEYEIQVTLADGVNPDEAKDKLQKKIDDWLESYVAGIRKQNFK